MKDVIIVFLIILMGVGSIGMIAITLRRLFDPHNADEENIYEEARRNYYQTFRRSKTWEK